jgi:hypothetical protein
MPNIFSITPSVDPSRILNAERRLAFTLLYRSSITRAFNPTTWKTHVTNLISKLYRDEAGFIVSAELVLISTITVLGLVVGLSEVALNVNNELEDVGSAFCAMQQSYSSSGSSGHKGKSSCSSFRDGCDFCDGQNDIR